MRLRGVASIDDKICFSHAVPVGGEPFLFDVAGDRKRAILRRWPTCFVSSPMAWPTRRSAPRPPNFRRGLAR